MLTDMQRALAIEIVLDTHDPEEFGAVNDLLCRKYPNISTDDLVSLWREAGARQLAEAEELAEFAGQRRAMGQSGDTAPGHVKSLPRPKA